MHVFLESDADHFHFENAAFQLEKVMHSQECKMHFRNTDAQQLRKDPGGLYFWCYFFWRSSLCQTRRLM
jgi:hypothetical protein